MNLKEIKNLYGDKISIIGNVDASILLPLGTYEDVKKQINECIKVAAPGGGYIFASDHSLHPGIPGKKIRFLFKTAEKLKKYPIKKM
jgi:uroporphyrinogen decarboxylase